MMSSIVMNRKSQAQDCAGSLDPHPRYRAWRRSRHGPGSRRKEKSRERIGQATARGPAMAAAVVFGRRFGGAAPWEIVDGGAQAPCLLRASRRAPRQPGAISAAVSVSCEDLAAFAGRTSIEPVSCGAARSLKKA